MSEPERAERPYCAGPRMDFSRVSRRDPHFHVARELRATIERLAAELEVPGGGRVLDLGCAEMPYRALFGADIELIGADLAGNPAAAIEIRADGTVPAPDESFDAVLSTQVLEHVGDPGIYLGECHRLLRPGGRLLLSTHGLMAYHPDPVDLWRWTGPGLRRQLSAAGFAVEHLEGVVGRIATGLQLVQDGILARIPKRLRSLVVLCFQPLASLADRLGSPPAERENAMVFALLATRT